MIWCFYTVAILSALALIAPVKWPRSSLWLAAVVLVLGVITLGLGGYIAYAGGKIRHREFRNESPPKELPKSAAPEVAPAGQPATTAVAAARVTIRALKYSPETIKIRKGETIEWANNDLTPHTVTSQGIADLNSGPIDAGASWRHMFTQAGTFSYFCTFHPEMKGDVVVE